MVLCIRLSVVVVAFVHPLIFLSSSSYTKSAPLMNLFAAIATPAGERLTSCVIWVSKQKNIRGKQQ